MNNLVHAVQIKIGGNKMGVRLSIEGSESIKLQETSITGIEFGADILMIPMQDLRIWGQRY